MPANLWSQPRWSNAWLLFAALLSLGAGWSAARVSQSGAVAPSPSAPPPVASFGAATADPVSASPPAPFSKSAESATSADATDATAATDELARAARGDLAALKRIELRVPRDRTIGEALALEAGHAALARADAERLVQDLRGEPKLLRDRSTLAYAYRLALDPAAAPTVLAGFADIDDPAALDLLFDLVLRGEPGSRLVLLAVDLLEGAQPRQRASKALRLALDLRAARDCWQTAEAVRRAIEDADDRSLSMLERLREERGCGAKKQDDCHGCLREAPHEERLAKAIDAARSRAFKAPWLPAHRTPR